MRLNNMNKLTGWCSLGVIVAVFCAGCGSSGHTRVVDADDPSQRLTSKGLDPQDFSSAAAELTREMLAAPRLQHELAAIDPKEGQPLIKISRIRNDTGLKINMVDYLVTPIEEVLVNSGKVDFFSEDKTGQDIAAGQQLLGKSGQPKLPDFVLHGTVSRLSTAEGDTSQNAYTFQIRLTSTSNNAVFFVGSKAIIKQGSRANVGF